MGPAEANGTSRSIQMKGVLYAISCSAFPKVTRCFLTSLKKVFDSDMIAQRAIRYNYKAQNASTRSEANFFV